jgi:hypothetical protein
MKFRTMKTHFCNSFAIGNGMGIKSYSPTIFGGWTMGVISGALDTTSKNIGWNPIDCSGESFARAIMKQIRGFQFAVRGGKGIWRKCKLVSPIVSPGSITGIAGGLHTHCFITFVTHIPAGLLAIDKSPNSFGVHPQSLMIKNSFVSSISGLSVPGLRIEKEKCGYGFDSEGVLWNAKYPNNPAAKITAITNQALTCFKPNFLR